MKLTDRNGVPTVAGARLMFEAQDESRANREGRADELARAAKRGTELHGSAPPPDAVRLYTHAELPAWVKPDAHHESNVSYFYGRPDAAEVWQAIFGVDTIGAMFLDLVQHEPKKKSRILNGDVTPLPGCVLIAVGVEQIRRARAGR